MNHKSLLAFATILFLLSTPTLTLASTITHTLTKGSSGADVLALQQFLVTQGYLTATPNGTFGPATSNAVSAFQTAHKLTPTGLVDSKTLALVQTFLDGTPSSTNTTLTTTTNSSGLVTQAQLQAAISAAVQQTLDSVHQQLYGATSTIAGGGLWGAIAASQRINNLSNVTISGAQVNGVSGLTASDIPALPYLSSTYLSGGGNVSSSTVTATGLGQTKALSDWMVNAANSLQNNSAVSASMGGILDSQAITGTINVPNANTNGPTRVLAIYNNVQGPGTVTNTGHEISLEVYCNSQISLNALCIQFEAVGQNGSGHLNNMWQYIAQMSGNQGIIDQYNAYTIQLGVNSNLGGTITNLVDYYSPNGVGTAGGTITNAYSLKNDDPLKTISTKGTVTNSTGEELAPAAASKPWPGRYYWGVDHGSASITLNGLHTNTYWAPYLSPGRQSFSKFGVHISSSVAAATCQIAIYSTYYGYAAGAPVYGPYTVSAASTGDVEQTISGPYAQLDAGLWAFGVNCSSDSVAIAAYTENAAYQIFAPSSSGGSDVTPITIGTAWGTNPTITYISNASVMPQIWVRR